MSCGICGSGRRKPFKELGPWRLVKCLDCGVVYLNPRPSDEELRDLYNDQYFADRSIQDDHSPSSVEAEIVLRQPVAVGLGAEVEPPVRWLDVGSASGFLLAAAKRQGFQVRGIEISEWAAGFAQQQLGIDMFVGTLREFADLSPGPQFNLITAMSYLEHSPAPGEDLRLMADLLEPGGVVVLRVPNLASFDRTWHGDAWHAWHLPFHLYHFTPSSLTRLLEAAGPTLYRLDLGIWNPIVHLREARIGDGWRADHPMEGRTRRSEATSRTPWETNAVRGLRARLKAVLGGLFPGRDMILYARK